MNVFLEYFCIMRGFIISESEHCIMNTSTCPCVVLDNEVWQSILLTFTALENNLLSYKQYYTHHTNGNDIDSQVFVLAL